MKQWTADRLKGAFLCVSERPRWIEKEASWAYYKSRPMVFISQTELPRNAITESHLCSDQVLYLFGVRVPASDGFEVIYKTVTQIPGF